MKCKKLSTSFLPASAAIVGTLALASLVIGSSSAQAGATPLTLINDWKPAPQGTGDPAVQIFNGIVHFKGAIKQEFSSPSIEAFVLPPEFRPLTNVYVPIDMSIASKGWLFIKPSGDVIVQFGDDPETEYYLTSLDGASFALNAEGFHALTLIHGWHNAPSGTSNAAVKKINGRVHFKGAMHTNGTDPWPFVLPVGFRPAKAVYVSVALCNAAFGRLYIQPSGEVEVQVDPQFGPDFSSAACLTSLDGAVFSATNTGDQNLLQLINGWIGGVFFTAKPAASGGNGTSPVYLKGGMLTQGSNLHPFVLPAAYRPLKNVYLPVNLCDANEGSLDIKPSGTVTLELWNDQSRDAECFTSLDGLSFVQ